MGFANLNAATVVALTLIDSNQSDFTEAQLITRNYNDLTFTFRADGYFNMTKAAACFGKDSRKFFITQDTKDYIDALTPNVPKTVQLVETKRGNGGGTWAHPKLAIFFARWLDVRFAVWCDAMIEDQLPDCLRYRHPVHVNP